MIASARLSLALRLKTGRISLETGRTSDEVIAESLRPI
jgi:hypothetical protein